MTCFVLALVDGREDNTSVAQTNYSVLQTDSNEVKRFGKVRSAQDACLPKGARMTFQLLIATMHQVDHSMCEQMNLHSGAIIVNQCDRNGAESFKFRGSDIQMLSFNERGVGLSRNTALMRATADIIEFADDDMIFTDTYQEDMLREFEAHPEADVIIFNVRSLNPERPLQQFTKFGRITRLTALRYGCPRIAVRREKLLYHTISFSLLFGGGAKYSSGEDSLFLQDCLRSGLRVYCSPVRIADVTHETSTWFKGYTDKYFFDKGVLFAMLTPWGCRIYALLTALKFRKPLNETLHILRQLNRGIAEYRNNK